MLEFLLSLLVGWPAIITSVALAIMGLVRNNYRFLVAAAIIAVPFSWYLSGFPLVRSPVFLTPVLVFGSAWAMQRGREMMAWILGITFFMVIILFLFALFAGGS
ncbi:MAG TPA: hypothetical protein VHO49_11985 [Anaerolineales bacterium]|nr:hypothetical protein [Anaerolineales bacterium]